MDLILGVSSQEINKQAEEINLVLKKAEYTCACCGIQSQPNPEGELLIQKRGFLYLVVDDKGKEKVVCTLCHYAMNMDKISEPRFIYYPWLSQEQLNYYLHYLYTVFHFGTVASLAKRASTCVLQLNFFSTHLNKLDPTLVKQPMKLVLLLSWLQMEDPKNYLARDDKYLRGVRLIPFPIPLKEDDIKAAFNYYGTLLHEEDMEDKWQAIYRKHVKTRKQGLAK